jgi:hypothetical protein
MLFFVLFGIAGACAPIKPGEYRGALDDVYSLVIVPNISTLRMMIERDSQRDLVEDFAYEFDSDCRVVAADRYGRDGFDRIRTRVYEITRKLTVENIEYRGTYFFIGGWLHVVSTLHLVPGLYRLGSPGLPAGAGITIEDDSRIVLGVPIDGEMVRVKAGFKVTGPGRALITTQRDDYVWDQILLARRTFKWVLLNEFEAKFVGRRLWIGEHVFE